jgi:hypothetical protein
MKKLFISRSLWMILIIPFYLTIQAQNPTYLCELRNDSQTSTTVFEFDIHLLRTGTDAFEYAAGQFGILVNPLIKNGGVITASIVAGSTDPALTAKNQNPINITFPDALNCIRVAGRVPPGAGGGTIISDVSPGMRICRVRLTNTVAFGQFQPNLTWTTTAIYPTQINAYVDGQNISIMQAGSQTTNNLSNSILNPTPPPTVFTVNGGGVYCQGEVGLPVSLSNSELNVLYTLYKNNIAQVPDYPGTGSAINFGNQLFGTYTVTGTNGGGTTPMSGSAVIT